jgi:hypothetical protein
MNKYPMDFDAVRKGYFLTQSELEQITGYKAGTTKFRFALLGIQERIHKHTGFTVKIYNEKELRVLTDEEATRHNDRQFMHNVRGLRRRFILMSSVDHTKLSQDSLQQHKRSLVVQSQYIQALNNASKQVRISGARRATPGLPAISEGDVPARDAETEQQ